MKVKVYFNLHKNLFSVVSLEKGENYGKVIAHRSEIFLSNVQFKVSEAGQQRVLREKKKNVHAYCVGQWEDYPIKEEGLTSLTSVKYNPYKYSSFVTEIDGELSPVFEASTALLKDKQILATFN